MKRMKFKKVRFGRKNKYILSPHNTSQFLIAEYSQVKKIDYDNKEDYTKSYGSILGNSPPFIEDDSFL